MTGRHLSRYDESSSSTPSRTRSVLGRADAVLIEEVDPVGPEPFERGVGDLANALGPAVHACLGVAVLEAELGRDHDLVADGSERLAEASRSLHVPHPAELLARVVKEGPAVE